MNSLQHTGDHEAVCFSGRVEAENGQGESVSEQSHGNMTIQMHAV